jgi:hypothetical protein
VVTQNLARALRSKGEPARAEQAYRDALSEWESIAMDENQVQGSHLVIGSLHAGLGDLYFDPDRLDEAQQHDEQAIFMANSSCATASSPRTAW